MSDFLRSPGWKRTAGPGAQACSASAQPPPSEGSPAPAPGVRRPVAHRLTLGAAAQQLRPPHRAGRAGATSVTAGPGFCSPSHPLQPELLSSCLHLPVRVSLPRWRHCTQPAEAQPLAWASASVSCTAHRTWDPGRLRGPVGPSVPHLPALGNLEALPPPGVRGHPGPEFSLHLLPLQLPDRSMVRKGKKIHEKSFPKLHKLSANGRNMGGWACPGELPSQPQAPRPRYGGCCGDSRCPAGRSPRAVRRGLSGVSQQGRLAGRPGPAWC